MRHQVRPRRKRNVISKSDIAIVIALVGILLTVLLAIIGIVVAILLVM
jgi:hypothetical protein